MTAPFTPHMACPKCQVPLAGPQVPCSGCGLVYVHWKARQDRLAEGATSQGPAPNAQLGALPWLRRVVGLSSILLLAGFGLPLVKSSLLFDATAVVWPWDLWFVPDDPVFVAAMGDAATAPGLALWSAVPLAGAVAALVGRQAADTLRLGLVALAVGLVTLFLELVAFRVGSTVLGLAFLPATSAAGVLMLTVVLAAGACAAANHVRRTGPEPAAARVVEGVAGGFLALSMVLALVASSGPLGAWSIKVLYLVLAGLGGLCLAAALLPDPSRRGLDSVIGLAARAAFVWAPLAGLVGQATAQGGYETYVLEAGGGLAVLVPATIKWMGIYGGAAMMTAAGLAGVMARGRSFAR